MEEYKRGDKCLIGGITHYYNGLAWISEEEWLKFRKLAQEAINAYFDDDVERQERMTKYIGSNALSSTHSLQTM